MVIWQSAPIGGKVMVARQWGFGLVLVSMEPWGMAR